MTDRPILFSAPMIRALIEGRKTQTRRILNPQPQGHVWRYGWSLEDGATWSDDKTTGKIRIWAGDRLWVRESVTRFDKGICDQHVWYRAGHNTAEFYQMVTADIAGREDGEWPHDTGPAGGAPYKVPSIHMPRWASRLTLIVTDVRVERLQDISEEDARAEGCPVTWDGKPYDPPSPEVDSWQGYGRYSYCLLWSKINGPGSWDANPWVVAYTFRVIKQNIDDIERAAA